MDTNNFYFKDFTGDYYLSRDAEGISHLKVIQKMTAVFPDVNQNKGICLVLPNSNQGGANLTLPRMTNDDITVTRNGASENIYSIEKFIDSYRVCTGTEEYVTGEQEYEFQYSYEKVITDFSGEGRQELYWDTNGNEWSQRFDHLTARVHLGDEVKDKFTGDTACYVGKLREHGSKRCEEKKISDGVEFTASNLTVGENLTYALGFAPQSFVVPEPNVNYGLILVLVGVILLCVAVLVRPILKFMATREKRKHYQATFVKPEYQPEKSYTLPEMTEIYMGSKKDAKVGMLLQMIVEKRVAIKKGEKRKWSLEVLNLKDIRTDEMNLLVILNGGEAVHEGDEIKIQSRLATSKIVSLYKKMTDAVVKKLKADGLVEKKYKYLGASNLDGFGAALSNVVVWSLFFCLLAMFAVPSIEGFLGISGFVGKVFLQDIFLQLVFACIIITVIIFTIIRQMTTKYALRTIKGLDASRYMEGLEMYIRMAESERMKFLQSVKGADTSADGVVKLYEKLLPYAAVFGLEESWMNELQKYCEVNAVREPDYLTDGMTAMEISRMMRHSAMYATRASSPSSGSGFSGGGGFSSSGSGFSGGFSGGGGGGGGGGGR